MSRNVDEKGAWVVTQAPMENNRTLTLGSDALGAVRLVTDPSEGSQAEALLAVIEHMEQRQ